MISHIVDFIHFTFCFGNGKFMSMQVDGMQIGASKVLKSWHRTFTFIVEEMLVLLHFHTIIQRWSLSSLRYGLSCGIEVHTEKGFFRIKIKLREQTKKRMNGTNRSFQLWMMYWIWISIANGVWNSLHSGRYFYLRGNVNFYIFASFANWKYQTAKTTLFSWRKKKRNLDLFFSLIRSISVYYWNLVPRCVGAVTLTVDAGHDTYIME